MAFRIDYFREGEKIGHTPGADPLPKVISVAEDGLIRHDADFARIIDVDGSGAEVWSSSRERPLKKED